MSNVQDLKDAAWKKRGMPFPWYERLALNQYGQPKAILHNVLVVLEEHPEWQGLFRFNEFSNQVVKTRAMPCHGEVGEFRDVDAIEMAGWFGDPHGMGIAASEAMIMQAVEAIARRDSFHPVREYLEALAWDGVERLPTLFADFFGAEQSDYTDALGRNAMVAAVARVCWARDKAAAISTGACSKAAKVDFMVVLEGPQGLKKTSSIAALFGSRWFAEMLESPSHKDFYQMLPGRWAIEISEMNAFSKADVTKVKQAITTQVDVYRPSYGRSAQEFPRQCVFWGTTNEDAYLRDPTGARRFMPVRCTEIDIELLVRMRDQLWAEAAARYRRGDPWWDFPAGAADEQEDRYQGDSWEEVVVTWLAGEAPDMHYPMDMPRQPVEITTTDLMQHALRIEVGKHTRQDQMRVGAIMRRLGWPRKHVHRGGGRVWVYTRPPEWENHEF